MAKSKIGLYDCFSHWRAEGCLYIHADTHFDDVMFEGKIVDSEAVVKSINRRVGKNDTIIFLGDCGELSWFKKIKGRKILIRGNHDDKAKALYREYFDEVYEGALIVSEKVILSHEPISLPFMVNLHGHDHSRWAKLENCVNLCELGVFTFEEAIALHKGGLKGVDSIHRIAIDGQAERKHK